MLTHRGCGARFRRRTGRRSVLATSLGNARKRGAGVAALTFAAVALAGCASFSPDAGMAVVRTVAATALGHEARRIDTGPATEAARTRVRRLLASPLSAEAAAQIALFSNSGLQAAYNELGIADAVRVEASLPPNPTFSLSGILTSVELDVERRLIGD